MRGNICGIQHTFLQDRVLSGSGTIWEKLRGSLVNQNLGGAPGF